MKKAEDHGSDLVVFPELTVCGYAPRDLVEKRRFIEENLESVANIAAKTKQTAVALGYVAPNESEIGYGLFNMAGLLYDGKVQFTQAKSLLPQYDVFDERRHFEPALTHQVHNFKGMNIALSLCEDLWSTHEFEGRRLYHVDPMQLFAKAGAQIILNLSASPYTLGKRNLREKLARETAKQFSVPFVYCNLVGGNDELVFDGHSFVSNAQGQIIASAKDFAEDLVQIDLHQHAQEVTKNDEPVEEDVLQALILGLRDYMRKCSFERAVLGLSGGIDSAVVAAIASLAIGPKNVTAFTMPSQFTSQQSIKDAKKIAKNLKIELKQISIAAIYKVYEKELKLAKTEQMTVAEENIQARIRGNILMVYSNREGALVLSTGNKSELAVGYCTLYGDMAGGLAIISDIPKTLVYKLAAHINQKYGKLIPESVLNKAPSAELKPDQTDQDSLPPYEILDQILKEYIENHNSLKNIMAKGFAKEMVEDVLRKVNLNEYKRRQAPPGLKITSKAFGTGRRFPIAWKA
ncbi:MAG: NAD+ synthase [Pseudomonadota bacterium]